MGFSGYQALAPLAEFIHTSRRMRQKLLGLMNDRNRPLLRDSGEHRREGQANKRERFPGNPARLGTIRGGTRMMIDMLATEKQGHLGLNR